MVDRVVWMVSRDSSPALNQVDGILSNDQLCLSLRDAIRLGREGTLEEFDKSTPKFQRGQAAYLKICNHLRKVMARTAWLEEHPENQQCFVLKGTGDELDVRITYFAGHLDPTKKFFRINPKGKLTRISLGANREQTSFLDEEGFLDNVPAAQYDSELTLFLMSCWDWEKQPDGVWRIRIRSWLAFCDTPLNRRGEEMESSDNSRFTKTTIVAYRELDDYYYSGHAAIPDGPEPVIITPVVHFLTDIEDEYGQ